MKPAFSVVIFVLAVSGPVLARDRTQIQVREPGGEAPAEPIVLYDDEAPWIEARSPETAPHATRNVSMLIEDHLVVGTRITHFSLGETSTSPSNTYVGSINSMKEVQHHAPLKLFVQYLFTPYVGVELTWDEIEAETRNFNNGESDGNIHMGGPVFSVIGRIPNRTSFTPYAGLGFALFKGEFDEEQYWRLGYSSQEDYSAAGSPRTPEGGRTRTMGIDNDAGTLFLLGCEYRFHHRWSADVFLRWVDIDADAEATTMVDGVVTARRSGGFPMSHTTFGIGVSYSF